MDIHGFPEENEFTRKPLIISGKKLETHQTYSFRKNGKHVAFGIVGEEEIKAMDDVLLAAGMKKVGE